MAESADKPVNQEPSTVHALDGTNASDDAMLRLLDRALPPDALRDATQRVAQPLAPPEKNVARLLMFEVGEERFAVPAVDVACVTEVVVVRHIPHRSNAIVRGLCSIDGELLLCGSLTDLLELNQSDAAQPGGRTASKSRRMLVIGDEANQWAVEVESVAGVLAFDTDAFTAPPMTVHRSCARFTDRLVPLSGGGHLSLLDVPRVVSGFKAALS